MIPSIARQRDGSAPTFPDGYLSRVYAIPNPFRTREDFDRFHHIDVPLMTDDELAREIRCVWRRLDYEPDAAAAAWLTKRRDAVAAERTRRARSRRPDEVSGMPHPPRGTDAANLPPSRPPPPASIHVAGVVLEPPRRRPSRG